MRISLACLAALLVLTAAPPGHAAGPPPGRDMTTTGPAAPDGKKELDALFARLRRERNEKAAELIAQQIWQRWAESGSATIDLLMQWSGDAVKARKFNVALDFLDQVTTLAPGYAEGWNQRATVHFLMNDYARSMADIDKTLQLEPRHFGALAGMAQILENTGHKQKALEAYERVLAIYPMDRNVQNKVESLSQDLAGEAI
jgi:tetratricopeptide (TPR) repeat protein